MKGGYVEREKGIALDLAVLGVLGALALITAVTLWRLLVEPDLVASWFSTGSLTDESWEQTPQRPRGFLLWGLVAVLFTLGFSIGVIVSWL